MPSALTHVYLIPPIVTPFVNSKLLSISPSSNLLISAVRGVKFLVVAHGMIFGDIPNIAALVPKLLLMIVESKKSYQVLMVKVEL